MLSIDDFRKVELRVGSVLEVNPHPSADRLYVIRVDLGAREADGPAEPGRDVRELVAGIRACYRPDELVGRQVIVVANLEPAVIRGVTSRGMLLAAIDDGQPVLLAPDRPVGAGAAVS